jgi:hypothetical protein
MADPVLLMSLAFDNYITTYDGVYNDISGYYYYNYFYSGDFAGVWLPEPSLINWDGLAFESASVDKGLGLLTSGQLDLTKSYKEFGTLG